MRLGSFTRVINSVLPVGQSFAEVRACNRGKGPRWPLRQVPPAHSLTCPDASQGKPHLTTQGSGLRAQLTAIHPSLPPSDPFLEGLLTSETFLSLRENSWEQLAMLGLLSVLYFKKVDAIGVNL